MKPDTGCQQGASLSQAAPAVCAVIQYPPWQLSARDSAKSNHIVRAVRQSSVMGDEHNGFTALPEDFHKDVLSSNSGSVREFGWILFSRIREFLSIVKEFMIS